LKTFWFLHSAKISQKYGLSKEVSRKIRRGQFFYGWTIVGAGFVILFVTYGVQISFNIFFPILISEFGWTRQNLSGAFSVYTMIYAGISPIIGRVRDIYGPKITIFIGGILLSIGLGMMSQIRTLWQVYLFLGMIAGLGMSTVFVSVNSTIVKWFIKRRGLALGITLCGNGVGIVIIPQVVNLLIPILGWRLTYVFLAFLILSIMIGIGRLLIGFPEDMNLKADGNSANLADLSQDSQEFDKYLRPKEAVMTLPFWLLTASFSANSLSMFVPFVHLTAFSLDVGFTTNAAVTALSIIGGFNVAGRLAGGPFADRIGRKKALMVALILQAICWPLLFIRQSLWGLNLFAVLFGASYGWRVSIFPAIIGDYFGRRFAGSILGMIFGLEGISAGIGVFLAGYLFDITGTYDVWFCLATIGNLLAFLFAFALKTPAEFWKVMPFQYRNLLI
jgi:MFS family permease